MNSAQARLEYALHHSIAHTLEHLVFSEALRVDSAIWDCKASELHSFFIAIEAPYPGSLTLSLSEALLRACACQLFGSDLQDIPEALCIDTGLELANTITGHLLGHVLPPEELFRISLPIHTVGAASTKTAHATVACMVDGNPLLAQVQGEQLLELANELPDATGPDSPSGGWPASTDPQDAWGEPPPADPGTGRWPANGTGSWGKPAES